MNLKVKLAAYAVLVILAAWFGWGFYSSYSDVTAAAAPAQDETAVAATDAAPPAPAPDTNTPPDTNASPATNVAATNLVTNMVDDATNSAGGTSNTVAITAPSNHIAAATNSHVKKKRAQRPVTPKLVEQDRGTMIRYLAALIASLVGIGVLIAIDTTHLLGSQATNYLFQDVADVARDPAYERAEAEWANGRFLEAIELMRGFLKENPRELHAALRIAEIYEKDLKNYLAAALEYEEVLKHKLPPERWAWAAIHLHNLYSKLGQQPKATALLHRIVEECPRTTAAKKARTRLGMEELVEDTPEVKEEEPIDGEEGPFQVDAPGVEPPRPPPPPAKPPEPPKSNLPSGFSPKQ
ncbi:MAG: tetratricopeptide repeat protein [Limisphaerales bacterium]